MVSRPLLFLSHPLPFCVPSVTFIVQIWCMLKKLCAYYFVCLGNLKDKQKGLVILHPYQP